MKKKLPLILFILVIPFVLTSCVIARNFSYNYNDLSNDLVGAELIYIEETVIVFEIHWPVSIEGFEHNLIKTFSADELSGLIEAITDLRFGYEILIVPASVSTVIGMQGYCIALHYADGSYILIGQHADHRENRIGLSQNRTGRSISDELWEDFISRLS